jgi:Holliday junction resolvasome RuvABC endonuclease subunit
MRVLGWDGGFEKIGLALVDVDTSVRLVRLGYIETEKSDKKKSILDAHDNVRRLREICDALVLFAGHPSETGVQLICAERFSAPRNASVAAKMALSWGALIMYAQLAKPSSLTILQAGPEDLKRAVTGKGTASKADVQAALEARFPSVRDELLRVIPNARTKWEHPCDALGAVVACLDSDVLRMARTLAAQ